MLKYIGTKSILAKPMTRQEYNEYRGWELPSDENGSDEGYLVEYVDSPNSNHPNHKCYISWSPKDVFERAYQIAETPLDRLILEEKELRAKIIALFNAITSNGFADKVGKLQFELLNIQYSTMAAYRRILDLRIENLKTQEKKINMELVDFGQAIQALKNGKRVAREGWNGKGMFLFLLPASDGIPTKVIHDPKLREVIETETGKDYFDALGSIRMWTADKKVLTGWLASQTDMLSEDWMILE